MDRIRTSDTRLTALHRRSAAVLIGALLLAGASLASCTARPVKPDLGEARYDPQGRLLIPSDYREWVFLSSGLDMSYRPRTAASPQHTFGNVFVPKAAYRSYVKNGVWPDKTVLILEHRAGATDGSINKAGFFQSGSALGVEAHVKDMSHFPGGWAFFVSDGRSPGEIVARSEECYSCHETNGARDTTFVQFYPTIAPPKTNDGV